VCRLVRGEQTYVGAKHTLGPLALGIDLASDLLRVTPRLQRFVDMHDPPPPERFLHRGAHASP